MKQIITTVATTIKAFKLLSNPAVVEKLYKELNESMQQDQQISPQLGSKDLFYHKHYMVQIIN